MNRAHHPLRATTSTIDYLTMKILNPRLLTGFGVWCRAILFSAALAATVATMRGEGLNETALQQIQALQAEKASFTPAQQKMDSQLVFALKLSRNQPIAGGAVPNLRIGAKADTDGSIKVDITANVTSNLLQQI